LEEGEWVISNPSLYTSLFKISYRLSCRECALKAGAGPCPDGTTLETESEKGTPVSKTITHQISLMSFGYSFGAPTPNPYGTGVRMVYDLRKKIRNPWHEKELRKLNGLDPKVREFVEACFGAQGIIKTSLYYSSIYKVPITHDTPNVIAFGCAGGKHRSVSLVEILADRVRETYPNIQVTIEHRDIEKVKEEKKS
jgi:UPF0042 nucleotide-binding protein